MKLLRTPAQNFADLEGYPFEPHYQNVGDGEGGEIRIHYVDEGQGELILCLHGQPTWSYLYRKLIPIFVAAGYRVIAPDLVGFGKSDKPAQRQDHTYAKHIGWMQQFLSSLQLEDITLVCQDWGGLIGLRLVAENPALFKRVVTANTGLPDASGIAPEMAAKMHNLYDSIALLPVAGVSEKLLANEAGAGFMYWVKLCSEATELTVSELIGMEALGGELSPEQKKAYDAPFPSEDYQQSVRAFPSLVPIYPDSAEAQQNQLAWKLLAQFEKPWLTAFSDSDPVTAGAETRFQETVPGAAGIKHKTIKGAGHFLQETAAQELADLVIDFIRST
ncbi:MAG: haloalkane dehalogenase [Pseudomonadales bacterium]|nr:haloalkane dehalogenase [Pseudomonadales bacterium]